MAHVVIKRCSGKKKGSTLQWFNGILPSGCPWSRINKSVWILMTSMGELGVRLTFTVTWKELQNVQGE